MNLPPPPDGMLKATAGILVCLLCVSVLLMWVPAAYINPSFFQMGLYLITAAWALRMVYRPFAISGSCLLPPLTLAASWGLLQLASYTTVSRWETMRSTMTWMGNLTAFFLALQICQSATVRRRLLKALVIFALAITIVSLLQYFSMPDMVLWIYFDGFRGVIGPFESRDRYAAFAELVIPVALWFAFKQKTPRKALFYSGIAATLFAAVIAGSSRAGSILCAAEIVVVWVLGRSRRDFARGRHTTTAATFAIFAAIFTLVVGYSTLVHRFQEPDPYASRKEMLIASIAMVEERPWLGFGLGNFGNAYPEHAVLDLDKIVDQAHNDWAQWAAEGGIPFLLVLLFVAVWTVPKAIRSLWGIGILTVFAHSCVDFPLQARVLEFWVFTLLGALAAESESTKAEAQNERNPH